MEVIFLDNLLKNRLIKNELLLYFFIYSFLGWIMETIFSYIVLGYFDDRGFFIGPICPIYGFGMLILLSLSYYKENPIKLFIISTAVCTFFEYLTGYALEAVFQLKWWDYSNNLLNINGRICLPYALGWGFISLIFIMYVHPFIVNIIKFLSKKKPPFLDESFLKPLFVIFIIDFVLSTIQYLEI